MSYRRAGWAVATIFLFLCVLPSLAWLGTAAGEDQNAAAGSSFPDLIFVQTRKIVVGGLAGHFPQGSQLMRLDLANKTAGVNNLTPRFFAAADPQVSFDGRRVLFSAKRTPEEHWQVWEMNADGSGQKQVTNCPADCLRADYLPQDKIVYTARTVRRGVDEWRLVVSKNDGSEARPITFGPGDFETEAVLQNGLILASASWPLDPSGPQAKTRVLYTLKPDGTELETLRYERDAAGSSADAAELDDGSIVFERTSAGLAPEGGTLTEIKPGALRGAPLGPQTAMSWSPADLTGDELVVARWMTGQASHSGRFDLYSFARSSASFGRLIYSDPPFSSVQPVPLKPRPAPRWFWSLVQPEAKIARLICLDSYLAGDEPNGRISGTIARVRVLTFDSASNAEKALGEAPVERDGSFYIAVPPDRPVRFELLDPQGHVLRAQKSWVWGRPGEDRGCSGCHQDRSVVPQNQWPLTLRRFDTPTPLGVATSSGAKP